MNMLSDARFPGQYPDSIHQRFIAHTGTTHAQIVGAFNSYFRWWGALFGAVVSAILINWWIFAYRDDLEAKYISAVLTMFTLLLVWHRYQPDGGTIDIVRDYRRVGKVMMSWLKGVGMKPELLEERTLAYCLHSLRPPHSGIQDARMHWQLSEWINTLLTTYAFRTMAHEESDKRLAEYWRKRFAQTFRVAIMLRLIPEWYTACLEPQSSKTHKDLWKRYFDPKVTGQGHVPTMNWDSVPKTTPQTPEENKPAAEQP